MPIADIIRKIKAFQCPRIEVTGGEPLLQDNTPRLITELLDRGYTTLLETNGSQNIRSVDERCIKIVDIKCPGSGESHKTDFSNLDHLKAHDQLKFVLTGREDFNYAINLLLDKWGLNPPVPILFAPAFGLLEPAQLAAWILKERLPVRLQLQIHKLIWPTILRGV